MIYSLTVFLCPHHLQENHDTLTHQFQSKCLFQPKEVQKNDSGII